MVLDTIDWIIIAAFLLLSLVIGLVSKKNADGGLQAYFLGGRNLPWYIAGLSMVATTFAADTPLAVAELVAQNGVAGNWLWWSFLAGGMLTTFFFARLWRRANIVTELELIDLRYGGKPAKWLRSFKSVYLGLFMNCMIIGWVNLALNTLLIQFFHIPTDQVLYYTGGAMLLAAVYSALGGLMGVALTDTVQFIVAMIGTITLSVLVINSDEVGGISGLKTTLPDTYFNFFLQLDSAENTGTVLSLSIGAFLSFAAIQWWASWYPGSEPGGGGYIAQRMMSVKTEKDSFKATLLFQLAHYCLRPWPWILVGLAAIALYSPTYSVHQFPEIAQVENWKETGVAVDDAIANLQAQIQQNPELEKQIHFVYSPRSGYIQTMIDFLPTGLKGLLLVAFLSAYLSTISTQLNMGASFLVNDLIIPNSKKEFSDKEVVNWSRVTTLILMVFGLLITTQINSISQVWEFIMEAGAGLGLVLILRWYWWRINAWSEITAMVAPFIGYTIGQFILVPAFGDAFVAQKGTYIFTVVFTTISWIAVTYITPSESIEVLHNFVQRVRPEGFWNRVYPVNNQNIPALFLSWIGGVLLAYGLLLSTGKFLLAEWMDGCILFVVAAIGGVLLTWGMQMHREE